MKTSTKVLLGAGAAAAVGGLILALRKKSDSSRMESDSVDARTVQRKAASTTTPSGAAVTVLDVRVAEPKGWLGALVAHGGACMGFEIEYMTGSKYGNHYHLSPIVMAHWQKTGGGIEINMDDSGLLTNRYQEFPCPVYPMTSPMFLQNQIIPPVGRFNGGTTDLWKQAAAHGAGPEEPGWLIQWGLSSELNLATYNWTVEPKLRVDNEGYLEHRPNVSGSKWSRVYPGKRTADWAMHQSIYGANNIGRNNGLNTTLPLMTTLVPGGVGRATFVPEYWRKNAARLQEWYIRMLRWYYTARWLVWAGEMVRTHAHAAMPSWWKTHAALWAVGTPGSTRVKRPSYDDKEPSLRVRMTQEEVNQLLKMVVAHTPPPGSKGATGEQIAPPSARRSLCDIPLSAGSIAPPVELLDETDHQIWALLAVSKFKQNEKYMPWVKWYRMGVDIAVSCVSAGFGGAISSAVTTLTASLQQVIMTVATFALQIIAKAGMGSLKFDTGDIVGLVGSLLEASGLEADAIAALPPELWDSLKTAGAYIPIIKGTDWEQWGPRLRLIQQQLETIQILDKWNFADAAYGGLGLTGRVVGTVASVRGKL